MPSKGKKNMIYSKNEFTVIGNVCQDPECTTTASGHFVAKIDVASNYFTKNDEKKTDFINGITFFGDDAIAVTNNIQKGDFVCVVGSLQKRSWETEEGEQRSALSVVGRGIFKGIKPES